MSTIFQSLILEYIPIYTKPIPLACDSKLKKKPDAPATYFIKKIILFNIYIAIYIEPSHPAALSSLAA